jgi:hypothetical protein
MDRIIVGQARGEVSYYPIYSQFDSTGKYILVMSGGI